jgi:predicted dehydrogenase
MRTNKLPITLAQFGCGYWGPNLLRNFSALPDCRVKYVVDPSEERRRYVAHAFPGVTPVECLETVLDDPEIDAVVIATPARSHFRLATRALESGKSVLVEKPLATTTAEIDALARFESSGLVVMAGHTFVYNGAVRYVKNLIDIGELGDIRVIYSQRLNLGRIRSDVDALWNFAPHDVSIIQYWLDGAAPSRVSRHGMAFVQDGIEDVVFLNIAYPNKVIANVHVSWLSPQKVRRITVVGSKKMIVYDDLAEEKIAIFDKGIDRKATLGERMDFDQPERTPFSYRSGAIVLPRIDFIEPLRVQAQHFIECIRTGQAPLTGTAHARGVVEILEAAERSLEVTA